MTIIIKVTSFFFVLDLLSLLLPLDDVLWIKKVTAGNISNGNTNEDYTQFLLANGVARTPPMGYCSPSVLRVHMSMIKRCSIICLIDFSCRWNSWNHFQCNINEETVKSTGIPFSMACYTCIYCLYICIQVLIYMYLQAGLLKNFSYYLNWVLPYLLLKM